MEKNTSLAWYWVLIILYALLWLATLETKVKGMAEYNSEHRRQTQNLEWRLDAIERVLKEKH